jgi:aspartyl-tRNA(Asn)/glutamyl-tRNA(Gln) amidotransferase subunit A
MLAKSFDTAGIFSKKLTMLVDVFNTLSNQQQLSGNVAPNLYLDHTLSQQISGERLVKLKKWCNAANILLVQCDLLAETGRTLDSLSLLFRTIQGFEIIEQHDHWLQQHGHTLDSSIMERVIWARNITELEYNEAKAQQDTFTQKLIALYEKMNGMWVIPTTPSGPPALTMSGDTLALYRSQLMGLTSIAGLAGFPQLHLPMSGLAEGPCGFSLVSISHKEADLFATGLALYQGE